MGFEHSGYSLGDTLAIEAIAAMFEEQKFTGTGSLRENNHGYCASAQVIARHV